MLAQIPIRDNAGELSVTYDRKTTKSARLHLQACLDQEIIWSHRNRIFGHTFTDQHVNLQLKFQSNLRGPSKSCPNPLSCATKFHRSLFMLLPFPEAVPRPTISSNFCLSLCAKHVPQPRPEKIPPEPCAHH